MLIRAMLASGIFNAREINEMTAAFEAALAALNLVDRTDPITTLVAKAILIARPVVRLSASGYVTARSQLSLNIRRSSWRCRVD
jgi:hypothetical protein